MNTGNYHKNFISPCPNNNSFIILMNINIILVFVLAIFFLYLLINNTEKFIVNDPNFELKSFDSNCIFLDNETAIHKPEIKNLTQQFIETEYKPIYAGRLTPVRKESMILDDLKYNFEEDYQFVRPYRRNYKYYGIKAELNLCQMNGILQIIKHHNPLHPIKFKFVKKEKAKANMHNYNLIKTWLIDNINKLACIFSEKDIQKITNVYEFIKYKNNLKFHKVQTSNKFEYIYDKLYGYFETEDKYIYNYHFVTKIYRKNAEIYYIIYNDISYSIRGNKYYINKLVILGNDFEENIHFGKYKKNSFHNKDSNNIDCSLVNSYECNTKITLDDDFLKKKNKFLKDKDIQQKLHQEESLNKCFYKDALSEAECNSYEIKENISYDTGKIIKPGIWAKSRCTSNEECPYYKTNQNYDNERGGCVNNVCELPLNMKLITPTNEDKNSIPLCHNCIPKPNCKGLDCAKCCDEQNDKTKYPNLITPDYAYPNDKSSRLDQQNKFISKKLSPFKLI